MYKIILKYQTEIEGAYTEEVQICDSEEMLQKKYRKLLLKWVKILIPKISYMKIKFLPDYLLLDMIDNKVKFLNEKYPHETERSFNIDYVTVINITVENIKQFETFTIKRYTTNIFEYLSDYEGDDEGLE